MAYDSLNAQIPRAVFIGNGTRGPYTLQDADGNPIRIRDESHVLARRYSSTTDEVGTALVLNTDFNVDNADVDDVEITLTVAQNPLLSSERLVAMRLQTFADVISLAQGADFSGPALAAAISILTERLQEIRRDVDRAVKADWRETDELSIPVAPTTGQAALVRDADGSIQQVDVGDITTLAGLAAEISALAALAATGIASSFLVTSTDGIAKTLAAWAQDIAEAIS